MTDFILCNHCKKKAFCRFGSGAATAVVFRNAESYLTCGSFEHDGGEILIPSSLAAASQPRPDLSRQVDLLLKYAVDCLEYGIFTMEGAAYSHILCAANALGLLSEDLQKRFHDLKEKEERG